MKTLHLLFNHTLTEAQETDVALIQGHFGVSCLMASRVRQLGGIPIYATTVRRVVEKEEGDKVLKTSHFEHVRFREYPNREEA